MSRRGHLLPFCLLFLLLLSPGSCVPFVAKSVDKGRSLEDGAEGRGARVKQAHGLLKDDAALASLGANLRKEHAVPHALASARMSPGAAPEPLLGSQGSPGEDIQLPQSCGGCTWILTNDMSQGDTLTMTGAPDCGSGCPTTLDFTYSGFLHADGNRVYIDPRAFKTTGLRHVTQVDLSGLGIQDIPAGVFNQLTGLTRLDFFGNALSSVPAGVAQLTGLRILNLKASLYARSLLIAGALDQLTGLRVFKLSGIVDGVYRQVSLPAGVFDKLTDLRVLDVSGSDMPNLPAGIFDKMAGLTMLNLSGNLMSNLPAGIFDQLTGLTGLYLPTFRGSLPAGVFDQLTGLRFLSLDATELSELPSGVFDKLTGLTGLSLGGSRYDAEYGQSLTGFQILPAGVFDQLTNLTVMYLDPPTTFMCFVSIPSSVRIIRNIVDRDAVLARALYDALPRCD